MSNARLRLRSADNIVFWDVKGCPKPDKVEAFDFSRNVREALERMGNSGDVFFQAYGHQPLFGNDNFYDIDCYYMRQGGEFKKILVDILGYAVVNRRPLNFVLFLGDVSEDAYLISTIQSLKSRIDYNVLLSQPPPKTASKYGYGSVDWISESLLAGEKFTNLGKTLDDKNA